MLDIPDALTLEAVFLQPSYPREVAGRGICKSGSLCRRLLGFAPGPGCVILILSLTFPVLVSSALK